MGVAEATVVAGIKVSFGALTVVEGKAARGYSGTVIRPLEPLFTRLVPARARARLVPPTKCSSPVTSQQPCLPLVH